MFAYRPLGHRWLEEVFLSFAVLSFRFFRKSRLKPISYAKACAASASALSPFVLPVLSGEWV